LYKANWYLDMINYYKIRLLIPAPIKQAIRELSYLQVFSDWSSTVLFFRINHPNPTKPLASRVDLRIRQLRNNVIRIRTLSTDPQVVFSTFVHRFHLPPNDVISDDPALILDLGANIGCTMAHLACRYPQASIVGVELDAENASLCRQNILPWKERCRVVDGAVWAEDGEVQYERRKGAEDGFVAGSPSQENSREMQTAKAISLNTLVAAVCTSGQIIDYIKMDIEGAELEVMRNNTEWAARVRCIKIELHGNYSKADCIMDLQRLGFEAWPDNHHNLCVVGVRRGQPIMQDVTARK
jgi:FkbM family methyltransferase